MWTVILCNVIIWSTKKENGKVYSMTDLLYATIKSITCIAMLKVLRSISCESACTKNQVFRPDWTPATDTVVVKYVSLTGYFF